jgi:hypothetical protein
MLRLTEHISTSESNLKQASIGNAEFKKEIHTLSATEKISLRKIYQIVGISCKPTEEFLHSNTLLSSLKELARKVSGDAPLPEPINVQFIKNIENRDGNERLLSILEEQEDLKSKFETWSKQAETVRKREPEWKLLEQLTQYLLHDPLSESLKNETAAIRDGRLLLQEPDPVYPLLERVAENLKAALNEAKGKYIVLYDQRMAEFQKSDFVKPLSPEQKHPILARNQLVSKPEIKSLDPQSLFFELRQTSLDGWQTKIAALPGQFQTALEEAAQLSAPKAATYAMPRRTITSKLDIEAYVDQVKKELEDLLQSSGSVIIK